MFVVAYGVALHLMVFFVIARWGHGSSHHIGGTELQLLCTRMVRFPDLRSPWVLCCCRHCFLVSFSSSPGEA